jgi:hypothetical protein
MFDDVLLLIQNLIVMEEISHFHQSWAFSISTIS